MPVNRKNLDEAVKHITRHHPEALEIDEHTEAVSSGSYAIDVITGIGGFPRSRICEVAGPFSGGKSTLACTACASAQIHGLYPVYLDVENALDLRYAASLGFDYKDQGKGLFAAPRTAEDTLQIVDRMVKAGVDLVVVDSVAAMVPEKELEGQVGEDTALASRARVLSKELPRLLHEIKRNKAAVVFINQLRATGFGGFGKDSEETSGGNALKYYASMRIRVRQIKKSSKTRKTVDFLGKEREVPVASIHEAEIAKSKVMPAFRKVEFTIRFDEERQVYGIDNIQTLLDAAKAAGVIEQKAAWFVFDDGGGQSGKWQGDSALYDHALNTPPFMQAIKQKLIDAGILKWLSGA